MELTLEDIKQELKEFHNNQTIIDEYEKSNGKIELLYERATKITTILTNEPKGSPKVQDQAAECIAEYVDLQQANADLEIEYAVGMMKLKNKNLVIHHTIMNLKNPFKAILYHLFENDKTREEAAEILDKSKKWIDTMIGLAYIEYLKKRNERV